MKNKRQICQSYQQLMAERQDAEDMYLELVQYYENKIQKIKDLAFELNTLEWTQKKKTTNFNAWNLAVDSIRKEIISRLED
jgi:hypothetical protein